MQLKMNKSAKRMKLPKKVKGGDNELRKEKINKK